MEFNEELKNKAESSEAELHDEELNSVSGGIYPQNDLHNAIRGRKCRVCGQKICICKK